MVNIDDILAIKNEEEFEKVALELFRFQAQHSPVYSRYLNLIGVDFSAIKRFGDIPYLPIELYKSNSIVSGFEPPKAELIFTSSGTTGSQPSYHYVKEAIIYEKSFQAAFKQFYAAPEECNIYALLPSYLEREGSSLIYMINNLIERSHDGGFFLYNHSELLNRIEQRDRSKKTILFGVSFALLDMAEEFKVNFNNEIIVMETGGMKGRRKELPREELHQLLTQSLGVSAIHSEYGMCECLSQSYSYGDGVFSSPNWMRIVIRDIHDPFLLHPNGVRGAVNIVDLANIYSCSFIQTQDIGVAQSNNFFRIEGRLDSAEIRGCSLLISE